MNNRKFEIEHEKHVVGVAQLVDTVGKVLIDAGQPPRVVALQAQITCNQYGVSLEEVAKARVVPWTMKAPSAMDELQKQDPRLYTYCIQNNYEVQRTDYGLLVTGGPDPDDPLDFMTLELFRAITYAIWEGREGTIDWPSTIRELGWDTLNDK